MRNVFTDGREKSAVPWKIIVPALCFLAVFVTVLLGTAGIGRRTREQGRATAEEAVRRAAVQCLSLIHICFVLIGLGLICYSISSKVLLLASVWRRDAPLSKRIPMIPVMTALSCLFLAAFLFEASYANTNFFVPAHIMVGLGAVCFTLFAIVSILESGTSKAQS